MPSIGLNWWMVILVLCARFRRTRPLVDIFSIAHVAWPPTGNRALFRKIHMENPMQQLDLEGVQGPGRGELPLSPPFKIQICVQDFPHDFSEKVLGCLFVPTDERKRERATKRK